MKNNSDESNRSSKRHFQRYEGAKTLVLGATGFIGRWVARNLNAVGANVVLPVRDRISAQRVFAEFGIEGEIFEIALLDEKALSELIKKVRPAITFNLAGYGVKRTEESDDLAYWTNAQLVENLCKSIGETQDSNWAGQDIVHVGTAMEYGAIRGNLAEDSPPNPTTLYGKSKLAGTKALTKCCQEYRLKGLTARLFAVYGPGETPGRLMPTLISAARTEEEIELTAGLHERDFVYTEDTAAGLLRLGLASAKPGEVVNLATGKLSSIRHFAETAADELGISRERLKFGALPTRPEEMKHKPVTIRRLRELTGWTPKTTIIEGVRKALAFEKTAVSRTFGQKS